MQKIMWIYATIEHLLAPIHLFLQLLNKYLLVTHSVPGSMLDNKAQTLCSSITNKNRMSLYLIFRNACWYLETKIQFSALVSKCIGRFFINHISCFFLPESLHPSFHLHNSNSSFKYQHRNHFLQQGFMTHF